MSVYRLLRPNEDYTQGLYAKTPASPVSVFDHVLNGSSWGSVSKYISTCGDRNVLEAYFVSKSVMPGKVVMINTNMLQPNQIIDLRQQFQRDPFIPPFADPESKNRFNNYANRFQEVLLEGYIPPNSIQLA